MSLAQAMVTAEHRGRPGATVRFLREADCPSGVMPPWPMIPPYAMLEVTERSFHPTADNVYALVLRSRAQHRKGGGE